MKNNCKTYHASGDADLLIVQKAVESASAVTTLVVGEDTDFLILLCYHANTNGHNIYFLPEQKMNSKKHRVLNINAVKSKLVNKFVPTFSFSRQFLVATQLLTSMALGRVFH